MVSTNFNLSYMTYTISIEYVSNVKMLNMKSFLDLCEQPQVSWCKLVLQSFTLSAS